MTWMANLSRKELEELIGFPGEETDEQIETFDKLFDEEGSQ